MKRYALVPAEEWTCTHRECDICGKKAEDGKRWCKEQFAVKKTKVKCYVGRKWPDDADTECSFDIDICPKCFVEKLVPWVNSFREGKPPVKNRRVWGDIKELYEEISE